MRLLGGRCAIEKGLLSDSYLGCCTQVVAELTRWWETATRSMTQMNVDREGTAGPRRSLASVVAPSMLDKVAASHIRTVRL